MLLARARLQPRAPVRPPRTLVLLRDRPPLVRGRRVRWGGAPRALGLARRVDDAGDVPRAAEPELHVAAEELGRAIDRAPGRDVVFLRGNDVSVVENLPDVDRNAV